MYEHIHTHSQTLYASVCVAPTCTPAASVCAWTRRGVSVCMREGECRIQILLLLVVVVVVLLLLLPGSLSAGITH